MNTIIKVTSISTFHDLLGTKKPSHPLITMIKKSSELMPKTMNDQCYLLDFYMIIMFEKKLLFAKPGWVMDIKVLVEEMKFEWILCFHPELIRGSRLESRFNKMVIPTSGLNINLTSKDKLTLKNFISCIGDEYKQNIDIYTPDVILSNIEVLMNYCKRFYAKQDN